MPVITIGSTLDDSLASESPFPKVNLGNLLRIGSAERPPPYVRISRYQCNQESAILANVHAQGQTNRSVEKVVVVQGELDALRYGNMLQAPGLVGVRGVGNSYDGNYYVQSVKHTIRRGEYKQQFTLNREGYGSTVQEVNV